MTLFYPIHKNLLQKKKKPPHFTFRIGPIERGGLVLPYAPNPLHPHPPSPPQTKKEEANEPFLYKTPYSAHQLKQRLRTLITLFYVAAMPQLFQEKHFLIFGTRSFLPFHCALTLSTP